MRKKNDAQKYFTQILQIKADQIIFYLLIETFEE